MVARTRTSAAWTQPLLQRPGDIHSERVDHDDGAPPLGLLRPLPKRVRVVRDRVQLRGRPDRRRLDQVGEPLVDLVRRRPRRCGRPAGGWAPARRAPGTPRRCAARPRRWPRNRGCRWPPSSRDQRHPAARPAAPAMASASRCTCSMISRRPSMRPAGRPGGSAPSRAANAAAAPPGRAASTAAMMPATRRSMSRGSRAETPVA